MPDQGGSRVDPRDEVVALVRLARGDLQVQHHAAGVIDGGVLLVAGLEPPVAGVGRHTRIGIGQADLLVPARLPAIPLGQQPGCFGRARLGRRILRQHGIRMPDAQAFPGDIGADQRRVDMHHLALGDAGRAASLDRTGEDPAEAFGARALQDSGQAGMVGQALGQAKAREPADGEIDVRLAQ